MKKLFVIFVCLIALLITVPVMAESYFSAFGDAEDDTSTIAVVPEDNSWIVVQSMKYVGAAATADLDFYTADNTVTTFSADEAAAQTALSVTSCTGLDDNDFLVLVRAGGTAVEATQMSACNDTTDVATVIATNNAYKKHDFIYEMVSAGEIAANVGSGSSTTINGGGAALLVGKRGKPIAIIEGSTSSVTFQWFSGTVKP